MDNRIFNVNGSGIKFLTKTLELAFSGTADYDDKPSTCVGWMFSQKSGMILFNYHSDHIKDKVNKLPDVSAEQIAPIVWAWLQTEEANAVECEGWDEYYDHDGHNTPGWRVFVDKWGHVDNHWGVICAIKPAYMWHGK